MTLLEVASALFVAAAICGVLNYHFLKLPQAVGIMVVALLASLLVVATDLILPDWQIGDRMRALVAGFPFSDVLLEGMLGLLLFAGALHVSVKELRANAVTIFAVACLGVLISTGVIGFTAYFVLGLPLVIALVFGAIATPTDPVAVLGVLRKANLSKAMETRIAGESLFNDGVAYVVYLVLVALAFGHGEHAMGLSEAVILFFKEALGGAILGGVLGWITFAVMRQIDDFVLEVLLSLALVFGGYALALELHVSAPIMAVVAGLLIGHVGMRDAMSAVTREKLDDFWKIIDELLNALLFAMIGFEIFAITVETSFVLAGAVAIVAGLGGRFLAVVLPLLLLQRRDLTVPVVSLMTWGGIKGGISIALALALPDSEWKPLILTAVYIAVVFSILVQGLTVGRVAESVSK